MCRINSAHAWSCVGLATEADLASLICGAEQLSIRPIYIYTDAALVLDASARVAEIAESGLVDVHVCVASTTMHGLQVSHQQCCVGSACMVDDAMQVHSKC